MQAASYNDRAPGELVQGRLGDIDYQAFVPHPLPPAINLSKNIWRTLSDADRAMGELAGVGRNIANPKLLIRPFIRREAVLSSRIEGTRANLVDVYAFEAKQRPAQQNATDEADVREVHNYVRAMEYGLEQLRHRRISLGLLREMHQRLLSGVRGEADRPGEYRDVQNGIGADGDIRHARFVPPPVMQMRDALEAFEKYMILPDDYPPLVRLALLHYQFETIHPFRDGNGRIGRLLISLLTVHWNLLPAPLLYISAYFERMRRDYYDHLSDVSQRGEWEEWIIFFLTGVAEQARDASRRAKKLQDLQAQWRAQLQEIPHASTALWKGMELLFEEPMVDAPRIEKKIKVTHPTALKILRKLTQLGLIKEVSGRERAQSFRAEAILRILQ